MKPISREQLEQYRSAYEKDRHAQVLSSAMAKTEITDLAFVPMQAAKLNGAFEVEVRTRGITAQQKSGRCWMFAAMNIMREKVADKCNLKEFELSQNYLAFYDKLEKANNFLEMIIADHDHPVLNDFQMYYLLTKGIGDGGYWGMAVDLVRKYGVCPKDAMPETYQSEHTDKFMTLLNQLLKKDAVLLRQAMEEGKDAEALKDDMLREIYRAECIAFGEPVRTFDFTWRDEKNEYHEDRNLTPQSFYEKYVGMDLDAYIPVICEPTSNKEMNGPVVFHSIGNMADHDLSALSLDMDAMEALCVSQLKDHEAVWFGCDAGAYGARKEGVWDPDSVDYEGVLGDVSFAMSKKDRLEYKASSTTHAMILTGVHFDAEGKPERWKIENSWGKENGKDGYYTASEKYFRNYVYEAVINKKHFSSEQLAMLEKEPVVIHAWDEE